MTRRLPIRLIALYSIRSARLFCEQLDYNLLFRWFLDMNADDAAFDHSSFTKNSERLLKHDVAGKFFAAVVEEARARGLLSSEHFMVDGTLIEAWASLKSSRPKGEKPADREPADDPGFVEPCRELGITPHVAAKAKHSAVDGCTTRHESYKVSQRVRKRVEEIFGWTKTIGGLRQTRFTASSARSKPPISSALLTTCSASRT